MDESDCLPPNLVDSTSSKLLARLGQQDAEAWRQLVFIYGPVVRYWIRAGLNRADLADVFQEVFLAVSRNIAGFHRDTGVAKFRAWLKTITLSKVHDHYRRQGKQPAAAFGGSTATMQLREVAAAAPHDTDEDHDEALAHSEDAFLAQRMLQIVRKEFSEQSWTAFCRTAIDGLTSQEAATELGITPLAVRKAKSRVLQRLKEAIGGSKRR